MDTFTDSYYTAQGEVGFHVAELACGHHTETDPVRVGPAPGAPSVGPGVLVAASHYPADLVAASIRQHQLDARHG